MASQEIHLFVEKFHQLWKAGPTTHLDIDTHAGEAWMGVRVKLGYGCEHHREGEHPASFHPIEENFSHQHRRRSKLQRTYEYGPLCIEYSFNTQWE